MLVHLTVCREHLRACREFIDLRQWPEDHVDTWSTELLMHHWGQVSELLEDTEVWRVLELAAA